MAADFRQQMTEWLTQALEAMGFHSVKVDWEDSILKGLVFNISAQDQISLIGRQGQVLQALESLAKSVARRMEGGREVYFFLDIDDYRRKREWRIKETVREAVVKTVRLGKRFELPPMTPYERKIVHNLVTKEFPNLTSASFGKEPNRRVVLEPKHN